jgi:RND family efflux transporter MFP subunit
MTDTIELELAAAKAELENRQQRLTELENGARPEELEQARAQMAAAEARREFLRMRRDRLQSVSNRAGAVTEDEVGEAVALAIEAEEAYQQAKAAYDLTVAGTRIEQVAQARALVALQQAVVDRISDQITKHTIVSRFGGYVVMQHTEVGQWVNQGDPVAEVVAIDEVDVVAQVVEKSVPFIRPGEFVRVEIPAVADRIFEGQIVATVPQADVRARTFPVKVRVKNEIAPAGPLLKAGMYARVALPVGGQESALLVPKDAIVLGGPTPAVFTLDGSTAAGDVAPISRVSVELGVADGTSIQILGNVRAGQLVVIQGNERLRPGQDVKLLRIDQQKSVAARAADGASSLSESVRPTDSSTSTVAN